MSVQILISLPHMVNWYILSVNETESHSVPQTSGSCAQESTEYLAKPLNW